MSNNDFKGIIEVNNFTKDYGSNRGVFDVSFAIKKGQFFGFLGPNGAGKSTTIRHLMGFSKPDKGNLKINGLNTFKYHSQLMKILLSNHRIQNIIFCCEMIKHTPTLLLISMTVIHVLV